jgi:hypothetical protein
MARSRAPQAWLMGHEAGNPAFLRTPVRLLRCTPNGGVKGYPLHG